MFAKRYGIPEDQVELPGLSNALNGSLAGALSGLITNPMDVLKTKMMTFQGKSLGAII